MPQQPHKAYIKLLWGKLHTPSNSAIIETYFRSLPDVFGGRDFDGATSDNVQRAVYRKIHDGGHHSGLFTKRLYFWSGCT